MLSFLGGLCTTYPHDTDSGVLRTTEAPLSESMYDSPRDQIPHGKGNDH